MFPKQHETFIILHYDTNLRAASVKVCPKSWMPMGKAPSVWDSAYMAGTPRLERQILIAK